MLKQYNIKLRIIGEKLRNRIIFDIFEKIDNYEFLKIKYLKTKKQNDLVLKFI